MAQPPSHACQRRAGFSGKGNGVIEEHFMK